MATLTTTGGATITFAPTSIDAIADHNDTTGAAVTCIYGIPPTMLVIGRAGIHAAARDRGGLRTIDAPQRLACVDQGDVGEFASPARARRARSGRQDRHLCQFVDSGSQGDAG